MKVIETKNSSLLLDVDGERTKRIRVSSREVERHDQNSKRPHSKKQLAALNRTLRQQHISYWNRLRSFIAFPTEKEPPGHEYRESTGHQRRVVHARLIHGHREREAENDDKRHYVQATESVYDETTRPVHVEPARLEAPAAAEEVREDGGEVGEGGELDV